MTAHILVVEGEEKLARFIELELRYEGYRVSVAPAGTTGIAAVREIQVGLIIWDWSVPDLLGLEICRHLQSSGSKTQIILLSAIHDVSACITGLDAGADDYVVKPVKIEELLARVRARLRRTQADVNSYILQFEDLSLNRRTWEVYRGKRLIELTAKEFELLEYLLSHPRQVIPRTEILQQIWGYDFLGDSNIIEVYIRYLRLKLEVNDEKRLIHTVRGVGYVLRQESLKQLASEKFANLH